MSSLRGYWPGGEHLADVSTGRMQLLNNNNNNNNNKKKKKKKKETGRAFDFAKLKAQSKRNKDSSH